MTSQDFLPLPPVSARLQRFFAYWKEKCADRPMPARADLDPMDFPWMLGDVVLVDIERDTADLAPPRFRFRLFGTNVAAHLHMDMTGRYLEEYPGDEFRARLRASYGEVAATGRPVRTLRNLMLDGRFYTYEALVLPLGAGGETRMLCIALHMAPAPEQQALGRV